MKSSNGWVAHVWLPAALLLFTPSPSCRRVNAPAAPRAPSGSATPAEGRANVPPSADGARAGKVSGRAASKKLTPGHWAGPHVSLNVTEAGAEVEFDCAQGSIDRAIELREDGGFEAGGTYTEETGGPAEISPAGKVGDTGRARAARYAGRVTGKTMTLSVTPEGGQSIGEFKLGLGATARLFKCQ